MSPTPSLEVLTLDRVVPAVDTSIPVSMLVRDSLEALGFTWEQSRRVTLLDEPSRRRVMVAVIEGHDIDDAIEAAIDAFTRRVEVLQ